MSIKGLVKDNMPKSGDIIYKIKDGACMPIKRFTAQVAVQEHPGQLKPGFSPIVHVRSSKVSCKMTKINWKISKKTGNEKQENPLYLEAGESAEIEFEPMKPFYLEPYTECAGLGRFAAMDSNSLVMLGKVMETEALTEAEFKAPK